MSISLSEVRHIALLARLRFSDEEETVLASEMNNILAYVDKLKEVNVDDVPAMAHAFENATSMRPDELKSRISRSEALSNAPVADGQFVHVPKLIN
ncbi:Asp-tRNA(Asn)/Glu-tRNA(Gln) amidotransferase subunit GatC [soil metagenome]